MPTYIAHRTDVVLSAVAPAWLTTGDIDAALYDAGHRWTTETTRHTLNYLASEGKIERRKIGQGYQWRTVPAPVVEVAAATVPRDAGAILDELRAVIEQAQQTPAPAPAGPITVAELDARLAEHPLDNLFDLDNTLMDRVVKRARYDALRKMLDVLDGWIEGAKENHEAMEHRNENTGDECWQSFHPDDIRRMVNDAAREVGTREPYRPAVNNG